MKTLTQCRHGGHYKDAVGKQSMWHTDIDKIWHKFFAQRNDERDFHVHYIECPTLQWDPDLSQLDWQHTFSSWLCSTLTFCLHADCTLIDDFLSVSIYSLCNESKSGLYTSDEAYSETYILLFLHQNYYKVALNMISHISNFTVLAPRWVLSSTILLSYMGHTSGPSAHQYVTSKKTLQQRWLDTCRI